MKSLKKTTLLVIASIALLTPQQKIGAHWAEDLIKGAAVCATIATGACLIGGGIYLACQPLSDSQEISRAENLYSDAQSKNDYLSSTYARELELFEFIPYTNQKNRIIIDIKSEIQSHYNAYAFMNFQDKLDSNIYSLDSMISSISSKENHLAERKNQLFSKENKLSYSERNKYAQEYDDLCNQLNSSHYILTQLRDRLYQLYCLVITFPECKKDKGLYKIHQLEKKVRKLENDINHPNSYYCNFSNYGYTASFAKINARIDYLKTRIKKLK
ncbi:hypothetical protein KAH94_01990, partial [bacterium]|nr:hypothetical protein [bacterium]